MQCCMRPESKRKTHCHKARRRRPRFSNATGFQAWDHMLECGDSAFFQCKCFLSNLLDSPVYFCLVLLFNFPGGLCRRAVCLPAEEAGVPQVVPIQLSEVDALSSVRIFIAKDLRQSESRALGLKVGPFTCLGTLAALCADNCTLRHLHCSSMLCQRLMLACYLIWKRHLVALHGLPPILASMVSVCRA